MEWTDEGIVVGVRRHGEAGAIIDVFTVEHGRHAGLVRGGAGSRMRPVLQPGNTVRVVWRARLDEHLGNFTVEGLRLRAAEYLDKPHALYALSHLCALVRLLPERDPHPELLGGLDGILSDLSDAQQAAMRIARFELMLLSELGFGLDLNECAATGSQQELVYVSPKSGRAVSRIAGDPWREKLLSLPRFLGDDAADEVAAMKEIEEAFRLTGYFLARHVFDPRGVALPEARQQFLSIAVKRSNGG
ncbi:DNA repair protein RecO [Variibacter gotjawalensis]|uniref:DNA repair protein RecO n=1 Tax=Variibacter gotjawalensis TaxID=1333996 RepID=A0A0S3PXX0_9BRAD|nr:DNA repair protein RecO [Variibacter gotjawalensis]NIK46558.1 DNA repair protein RecO (recombination protein O) [Variibacter gotjawalensis]RZS48462.1 DNA replication and repair protein RecO [Variibacter gotjawalensis]BAT60724.1 DNA repair protein RecO [Variibacter gotjawalensis]